MELNVQNIIFNYRAWVESCNIEELSSQLSNCLIRCNFTILQHCEHHFSPEGYTAVWVLAESHLALHTFPEHAASYIELSSCNEQKQKLFVQLLSECFITHPA